MPPVSGSGSKLYAGPIDDMQREAQAPKDFPAALPALTHVVLDDRVAALKAVLASKALEDPLDRMAPPFSVVEVTPADGATTTRAVLGRTEVILLQD